MILSDLARIARRTLEDGLDSLRTAAPREAAWRAKHAMTRIADATTVALLLEVTKTGGPRYERLAELYGKYFLAGEEDPSWAMDKERVWDTDSL